MQISDFYDKYSKEDIKPYFRSYISDSDWEMHKDKFYFHFIIGKEKNIPRSFINEYLPMCLKDIQDQSQIEYQEWRIFGCAIHSWPLGEELLQEYGDKISWSSLSGRKELTLEFFNKHKENIVIKDVTADLGKKFIDEYLLELDKYHVLKMKLNVEQMRKLQKERKCEVWQFENQKFFTKDFFWECLPEMKIDDVQRLMKKFEFSFEERLRLITSCENKNVDKDEWNDFLSYLMEKEFQGNKLTIPEQKDIKWFAWI